MFKKINAYLIKQETGKIPSYYVNASRNLNKDKDIPKIVQTLKTNMKPVPKGEYYRADSHTKMKDCRVEGFMSITKNKEDAEAFRDGTMIVYKVRIMDDVKGVKTGVEGEILIENGCFVEYKKEGFVHTLVVHPPDSKLEYPFCSIQRSPSRNKTRRLSRNRSGSRNRNNGI